TSYEDLACETLLCKRRYHTAGHPVIGHYKRLDVVPFLRQAVLRKVEREVVLPVRYHLIRYDLDIPAVDRGLKNCQLLLLHDVGVIIGRGTVNHYIVTFGHLLKSILSD